jgi:hypothetical protein
MMNVLRKNARCQSDHIHFPHTETCWKQGFLEPCWKIHRLGAVSKPCLWINPFSNPSQLRWRTAVTTQSVYGRATGWTIGVLGFIPGGGWEFFSSLPRPERLCGPPSFLSNEYRGLFPWGWSDRGVKLITHLHLVQRSKNEWSYTFTPPIRLHGVVLKAQGKTLLYLT